MKGGPQERYCIEGGRKRSCPAGTKTHLPFRCCPDLSIRPGCVPVLPQATAPRNPGVAQPCRGKVWGRHPNLLPSRFGRQIGRQDCFCRAGLCPLPEAFSLRPLTNFLSFQWGWDSPGSPTPAGCPPNPPTPPPMRASLLSKALASRSPCATGKLGLAGGKTRAG